MRTLKTVTVATLAAATAGLVLAAPAAHAADNATTPVTFTLTSTGVLSIASTTTTVTLAEAPGGLSLTGGSVSGALGSTTVTDARAGLLHNVTVNMAASDFVQKDASDAVVSTITKSNATAYSGTATGTLSSIAVPTTALTPAQIGNTGGATVLTVAGLVGSGAVTYNPTVNVAVPATAAAGTYTGTITQTVA